MLNIFSFTQFIQLVLLLALFTVAISGIRFKRYNNLIVIILLVVFYTFFFLELISVYLLGDFIDYRFARHFSIDDIATMLPVFKGYLTAFVLSVIVFILVIFMSFKVNKILQKKYKFPK